MAADFEKLLDLKSLLSTRYETKELGELRFILGPQIERNRAARRLHLSMSAVYSIGCRSFRIIPGQIPRIRVSIIRGIRTMYSRRVISTV